jgi:hypothetical protein
VTVPVKDASSPSSSGPGAALNEFWEKANEAATASNPPPVASTSLATSGSPDTSEEQYFNFLEIYKCAVLTLIAVILVGIWIVGPLHVNNTPDVHVSNTPDVKVSNISALDVRVKNTVEVEGRVSIKP